MKLLRQTNALELSCLLSNLPAEFGLGGCTTDLVPLSTISSRFSTLAICLSCFVRLTEEFFTCLHIGSFDCVFMFVQVPSSLASKFHARYSN